MFLNKKGDITLQQLVLLVVAVIMILVVTSFGSKIWGTFFPSADRSTIDSFNTFHSILDSKSVNTQSYSMTPATIYLGEDNCLIYFNSETSIVSDGEIEDAKWYHKPAECEGKPCLCLYDDDPAADSNDDSEKDDDVIECETIKNSVNLDDKYNDMNGALCGSDKAYHPMLVIKRTLSDTPAKKSYIYIISDNDTNRKLHAEWNQPLCSDNGICDGKKNGEVLEYFDDAGFEKIYSHCAGIENDYASISIKCGYNVNDGKCVPDCASGDIKSQCATEYKSCSDYNKIIGVENYVSAQNNANYKYYYMCTNDAKYCNHGCGIDDWNVYIFKDISSRDGSVIKQNLFPGTLLEECAPEYISVKGSDNDWFLQSYDESKDACKTYVNENFYEQKGQFMACKQDGNSACARYIDQQKELPESCNLKYMQNPQRPDIYWITYYDASCDVPVKERFEVAQRCVAAQ